VPETLQGAVWIICEFVGIVMAGLERKAAIKFVTIMPQIKLGKFRADLFVAKATLAAGKGPNRLH